MMSFGYLELATGGKAGEFISGRIKYIDEPLGNLRVVPDFPPRPEKLVFPGEGIKMTIVLSKRSVEFFKGEAQKRYTQYQRMIRRLLDSYADHHSRSRTPGSAQTCQKLPRAG